ncbi:TonB-dependent receptor [Bizionia arctica]|uniref:TonB-dependent receptor n=1 Tax=Bizionia arctica TaxID=1495645 RepID=A0A917GW00_9FLAO|nr:carboxypeptidase-like regulatory domain-containing protein [Bizionia arctica]GGG58602.1 TonB-dependent receptor [Bizionia arctica]
MKLSLLIFFLFTLTSGVSQSIINGKVTDAKNNPVEGANVYLEGTYDGTTTDKNGNFSFKTEEIGTKTLKISFVSYETFTLTNDISELNNLKIKLREDLNALDTVVISAGTFSAGDNSKISVLKPLDIVTTAGAMGDFVGALQTLPGTTTVAEDGRLFVRGGDASETQIFIDGIRVFTPYVPTSSNTPTRGRYSPFLFDGITFSTGGYSAEYGQALSSVLLLNTIDEPDQEKTDIGIMSVGATLGHTELWENSSLSVNGSYINLAPYVSLFPDRNDWIEPFQGGSGEAVFRKKFDSGLLKLYTAFEMSGFELIQEDINFTDGVYNKLNNTNLYFNGSYTGVLADNWSVFGGLSYTYNKSKVVVIADDIKNAENSYHAKFKLKHHFSNRFKLNIGGEYFATNFNEEFKNPVINGISYGFNNNITAAYSEADVFFSKNMALQAGLRLEYSELFKELTLSPRLSLAYKTSDISQISIAYGNFYQNPNNAILKFEQNLSAQKNTHYILNYQLNNDGKIFRAEAYYKNYTDLIKYDTEYADFSSSYNNSGTAYAAGLDLFWRDNKSIKNLDYWISYSFLDSERDYENYPIEATPNFVNTHNLSIVTKYWIENWKSQVGMSYAFASGRSYTNPNLGGFLNQETKSYNNLSLNWAYLISQQKILYFSVNNVLGIKNIDGYQYAKVPDSHGNYASSTLRPAADQFFFVGFFWTISEKGTDNQLNNL